MHLLYCGVARCVLRRDDFQVPHKKIEQNPKMGICIPDGVQREQMKKVLLKYLRDHPEKLHEPSAYLTLAAMQEAFPCR